MKKNLTVGLLLTVASLLGAVILGFSTRSGAGVGGDATIYITSARNLLTGIGLGWVEPDGTFKLLADFPPGYPLVLSLGGVVGVDPFDAARWINIFLFAALIWLCGFLIFKATDSPIYAMLAACLLLFSPELLPIYSWAMSEPLFLLTGFGAMTALWGYVRTDRGWLLTIAAISAGYSLLTRYSGITFLATGILGLLFLSTHQNRRRLRDAFVFSAIAAAPLLAWLLYDYSQTGMVASRQLGTGESFAEAIVNFWKSFSSSLLFWVLPDSWVVDHRFPQVIYQALPVLILTVIVVWGLLIFRHLNKKETSEADRRISSLMVLLLMMASVYLVVILTIRFTIFPVIAINSRMLAPIYLAVVLLAVIFAFYSTQYWWKIKWLSVAGAILLGMGILLYGWISLHVANQLSKDGLGYTSHQWQQSELLNAARQLPEDTILVSNEPKAVLLLTGRIPYALEEIYYREPLDAFSKFGDGDLTTDEGQRAFREQGGALLLFNTIDSQLFALYQDDAEQRKTALLEGLYKYFMGNDGSIYFYQKPH